MTSRIAVVGASAAGLSAAEALRRAGWDGEITLIGDEDRPPYDRPPLSKQLLSGEWDAERVALRGAEQLDALRLDLRPGTRAVALDAAARRVTLDDGTVLDCAGIVIATGVRARRLPGSDSIDGVHVLRTLDDALALRERLSTPGRRVVVVGTGVLGTEAAAVARGLGHDVALAGSGDAPMDRMLGEQVGALLSEVHRAHGVTLHTGQRVDGVLQEGGRATGVRLADGTAVEGDTVLVAVGSDAAVDWLEGSGLDADPVTGVHCDAYCAAAPGIYAAGDVARWEHETLGRPLRIEHRMNATEQGMTAARNLLAECFGAEECTGAEDGARTGEQSGARFGERKAFRPVPYFWSDQFGLKLQAYGSLESADTVEVRLLDKDPLRLVALYGEAGRAVGVLGVGVPPRQMRGLRALVATPTAWNEALAGLP